MWRLNMATKARSNGNGKTITQLGQSRILYSAKQVVPLTIFPDQITVEELRIIWIKKMGPWMNEVVSIMATDIASVNCSTGLFFGYIHVQSLTGGPEILVDNLLRHDVLEIRSLVEGIALSAREGLYINEGDLEAEKRSLISAGAIN